MNSGAFHTTFLSAILVAFFDCSSYASASYPITESKCIEKTESKPLWEIGVFLGAARIPDYKGSDQYTMYVIPIPFLIYRGERVQADRDGMRGLFYRSKHIETSFSLSGNPPVDGHNNARSDMPDLNALFEAGPTVKYFFRRREANKPPPAVYAQAALREAFSLDFDETRAHPEGLHAIMSFFINDYQPVPGGHWRFGMDAHVNFTDSGYNRYFYDVEPKEERPGRPAFESHSGYTGFSLAGYASFTLNPRWTMAAYARWDNLDGAVIENSPLVNANNNYIAGVALSWTTRQSMRKSIY